MPGKAGKEEISPVLFSAIAAAAFACDRLTKWAVLVRLDENQSIPVWPGIFHFTRVANTGAAFGILKGQPHFLTGLTAFAIASIVFFSWKRFAARDAAVLPRSTTAGWAMVLGGAAGNLFDRIYYGHVVDFLDFRVWPVFNVADSAICIGVLLVMWRIVRPAGGETGS